jgi:hypothetical protein
MKGGAIYTKSALDANAAVEWNVEVEQPKIGSERGRFEQ